MLEVIRGKLTKPGWKCAKDKDSTELTKDKIKTYEAYLGSIEGCVFAKTKTKTNKDIDI